MKPARASSKLARLLLAILLALSFLATSGLLSAGVAHAEGSRDLYPSGATGSRANIEWRTSYYGPPTDGAAGFLLRRTLLQVYAEPGEVILLGSSAVGVGAGDILLYSSDQVTGRIGDETVAPPPDFSCVTDQPGRGRITSRALELAGPQSADGTGNPGGYVPCYYEVLASGPGSSANNIYYLAFIGPSGPNSDTDANSATSGDVNLVHPDNFNANQNSSVAAWDVTVRDSLASTTDINGRLFGDYVAMLNTSNIPGVNSNPHELNATLYALTTDSYIYEVGLRGLDPYGFVVYSNDRGFLDSDGATPLLHDVLADPTIPTQQQNQLNVLQGGVSAALPTHHVFFNTPSPEARSALNATDGWDGVDPIIPRINLFEFQGVLGGNETVVGAGGTFVVNVNVRGIFLLVISAGVDFDPSNPANATLIGVGSVGSQQLVWDGLDNAGNDFGVPENSYTARILLRAGEVHFPLLDVENSQQGGPQYFLTNPPSGCPPLAGGCYSGFYDDRGYTTIGGTDVGTPGAPLSGISPPPVPNSDPEIGFDTRSADRAFGDGSQNGFGDKKGLDLWTYYPAQDETDLVMRQPTLQISKVSDIPCYEPGESQIVNYTIDYANLLTVPVDETTVTDTLPPRTTYVPGSCSGAPCNEISPGVVEYSLGTVDPDVQGSLQLAAQVADDATGRLTNRAQIEAVDVPAVEATDVLPRCTPTTTPRPPGIPEPTTLALVGLGLAGLAGYARRRRQRQAD